MNDYIINGSSLTNIANAIREKVGDGNVTYLPSEMPDAIKRISSSGGSEGKTYGFLNQMTNFGYRQGLISFYKLNLDAFTKSFMHSESSNISVSADPKNYSIYSIQKNGYSGANNKSFIIKSDLDILYLNENSSYLFYNCNPLKYPISYFTEIFNFEYVKDFSNAFFNCTWMYGQPICGNNVNNMVNTYAYCNHITGPSVCNDNVINMSYAYRNCTNLIGSPACGNNVVNMVCAYSNCLNLYGDMYIYYNQSQNSSDVNMQACFYNRNIKNRLNIYVKADSAYNNWLYNVGTLNNGIKLTWTTITNGYYNAGINTYVYYNL